MIQKEINFKSRHTYSLSHEPTGNETSIWVVFHGYGQLAQYFLKKFTHLFHEECLIVAPEGLNHYYLKGFSGRVGANWMTKHEREIDIVNNYSYLNRIMEELHLQFDQAPQVNVLGFSQGVATMSRWVCQSNLNIGKAVFWGGAPAQDLDPTLMVERLKNSQVILALGDEDPFLQSEMYIRQQHLIYEAEFVNFKALSYSGGHDLDAELLKEIFLM
ncbi:alpha/beta hydrolase [uncultured Cyclobacterium sp.]|uniref:alpha/beta hydrolase n=1 Tax=uncultured Cyclobacterium sp. TaxID=453820 RepID=UPI0030EC726D|tara:strand:- start:72090 stop:72737 length:648 start_codon:yes stop_codon:yes gene_type:complete